MIRRHGSRAMTSVLATMLLVNAATLAVGDIYKGIDAQRLLDAIGKRCSETNVNADKNQPVFVLRLKEGTPATTIALGVYADVDTARAVLFRRSLVAAPEPPGPPPGGAFGEDLSWRTFADDGQGPAAAVGFRRSNVVVRILRYAPTEETAALARQIDQLIQNDRQIAPLRGPDDHPPEIVSAGFPAALVSGVPTTITPEFRGLGDRAKLRVVVAGGGEHLGVSNRIVPRKGISYSYAIERPPGGMSRAVQKTDDGRFVVTAKGDAGPAKVTITAFGELNTIAEKTVEVQVVAPPGE